MSSGSYFTLYRKSNKAPKASQEELDALKNEYYLSSKNGIFGDNAANEEQLKADIPILLHSGYKADSYEDNTSCTYYSHDGTRHEKLLEFMFGSSFTCLKEKFGLNPYNFSKSAVLISKLEAEKILQAIEYVLSRGYSKEFERILNNEYVELLGYGYSPFDNRFTKQRQTLYIDKNGNDGYAVEFNDITLEREVAEEDECIEFSLNRAKACFLAFLNAEECSWDGEELVLEYSAY